MTASNGTPLVRMNQDITSTRSMASWSVYEALLGYEYDMRSNRQTFAPRLHTDDFTGFWCNGKAWGIFRQTKTQDGSLMQEVEVLYGDEGTVKRGK